MTTSITSMSCPCVPSGATGYDTTGMTDATGAVDATGYADGTQVADATGGGVTDATAVPTADASTGSELLGTAPTADVASVLQQLVDVLNQLVSLLGSTGLATAPPTADTSYLTSDMAYADTAAAADATLPEAPPIT